MEKLNLGIYPTEEKILEAISSITDKTRLQIIYFLGNKRLCVNEIASNFKLSRPAISHHLKVLKNCGIIQNEKVGQETYYYLERANLVKMLRDLADAIERCC
jgi:DNA-binding transcriptional ArsR family regulator